MEIPKENPLRIETLDGEIHQGVDDAAALPVRLARFSKAHHRALEMSHYAEEQGDVKIAAKLHGCGQYLMFRDYYTVGTVRLAAANFCKKHLLCPLCAIRRGAKMVKAYLDRLAVIQQQNPNLKAYLVTLTVKDGEDLQERFDHLAVSVRQYHHRRHVQGVSCEASKACGAVWSYEFKRGSGSGFWHPHVHAVWLCEEEPIQERVSKEWLAITGDSFVVNVTPFYDQNDVIGGFLEVFKYAVKFSDLPLADNWHGFKTLSKKRLIASFGLFRGVVVPESLTDELLDDLPFIEHLYKFLQGVGYSLTTSKHVSGLEVGPAIVDDSFEHEVAQAEKEFLAKVRKSGVAPGCTGTSPDHHQKQEF